MKRKYTVIFALVTALLLLGGCVAKTNVKSPTDITPTSRQNQRHSFAPDTTQAAVTPAPVASAPASGTAQGVGSDIKVGFLFIGHAGDYGFTYAQNQGRLAIEDVLGVETVVIEEVPEDESSITAIQELIDAGCTVIFGASYGYMEYMYEMAEKNPDIYFLHCSGFMTRENMSTYFGRIYQVRYLTGIVAGLRTETNKIGYVGAMPIPEVVRGVNAFALGVKSVNPDAEVHISWSYTWYDPAIERDLSLELIDLGCDVITQHQDTAQPQIAAQEQGVWSIGYNSPMGFFAPEAYLTGAIWNWAPFMIDQVSQVIDGTWTTNEYWGGIEDDVVRLDELTNNVSPGTRQAVEAALNNIRNGFTIFEGPIYDNEGILRVPRGQALTDAEKLSLDWLVDNIVGEIAW